MLPPLPTSAAADKPPPANEPRSDASPRPSAIAYRPVDGRILPPLPKLAAADKPSPANEPGIDASPCPVTVADRPVDGRELPRLPTSSAADKPPAANGLAERRFPLSQPTAAATAEPAAAKETPDEARGLAVAAADELDEGPCPMLGCHDVVRRRWAFRDGL